MATGKGSGSSKKTSGKKDQDQQQNGNTMTENLGDAATDASETVQNVADGVTQQARQQITSQITTQQERAVDLLDTVALLLGQAGEHGRKEEMQTFAQYADRASEQVEQFSNTIREKQPEELLEEAKQFVQQRPSLLVGGALAAGFLGARFFRSSTEQAQQSESEQESGEQETGDMTGSAGYTESAATGMYDYETAGDVVPAPGVEDTFPGAGTMTGVTDTSALKGTLLEEDAAILQELEEEERIRLEGEGLGGATTDDLEDPLDSETR